MGGGEVSALEHPPWKRRRQEGDGKCFRMGWALEEPWRKINLVILFLSLFLMFHSGELEASFQGLDAFLVFVYFERESLGAGDTPREGQGGDVSCYSGSTQSESWESHGGGVCVQLNLGGEASNSSLTTLCFKINLNRTVKSLSLIHI